MTSPRPAAPPPSSSAAWEDTAPMPKLEPTLVWPPSTATSRGNAGPPQVSLTPTGGGLGEARPWGRAVAAGTAKRPNDSLSKPGIQGLEVKELDGPTVFDQLFGSHPDAGKAGRAPT